MKTGSLLSSASSALHKRLDAIEAAMGSRQKPKRADSEVEFRAKLAAVVKRVKAILGEAALPPEKAAERDRARLEQARRDCAAGRIQPQLLAVMERLARFKNVSGA